MEKKVLGTADIQRERRKKFIYGNSSKIPMSPNEMNPSAKIDPVVKQNRKNVNKILFIFRKEYSVLSL